MQCEFRWLIASAFGGGSRLDTVVVGVAKLNTADESGDTSDERCAIGNLHGVGCVGGSDARAVVMALRADMSVRHHENLRSNENEASSTESVRAGPKIGGKIFFLRDDTKKHLSFDALLTTRKLSISKSNTCCVACTFYQRKVEGRSIARKRYGEYISYGFFILQYIYAVI